MKIAIAGAHSQGKTTLLNDLRNRPEFRTFSFLGNITRGINDLGININEGGSDVSQSLVIAKHLEHLYRRGNAVLDRCILDGVVYTAVLHAQGKVSEEVFNFALKMFKDSIQKYDYIFYVYPELALQTDNVRTTDQEFFNIVVKMFNNYINSYNIPYTLLRGAPEERVNIVLKTVKF